MVQVVGDALGIQKLSVMISDMGFSLFTDLFLSYDIPMPNYLSCNMTSD